MKRNLLSFVVLAYIVGSLLISCHKIGKNVEKREISIVDTPLICTDYKKQLIREYSIKHYGEDYSTIVPQVVVVHWTSFKTAKSTFNWFNREEYEREKGTLNVGAHFLVDRDGTIYRLMPETNLARHSIGYNWCAIGIENVGGYNGKEDLTKEQLRSNIQLIRYLSEKYPTIRYVWGHYQQDMAKQSGLYKENLPNYRSEKVDPGPLFMKRLHKAFKHTSLYFYPEE